MSGFGFIGETFVGNTVVAPRIFSSALTDTGLTSSDSLAPVRIRARAISDTGLTVTDSIQKVASKQLSDTGLTVTSTLARLAARTLADAGLTSSDSLAVTRLRTRTITDTGLTVTDAIGSLRQRQLSDTGLTVTDSLPRSVTRPLTDTGLTVTDSVLTFQIVRPVSDDSVGSWTTSPLWSKIDESVPNDSDFIQSPSSPVAPSACRVALGAMPTPGTSGHRIVRYRIAKSSAGGDTLTLTVRLYQGASTLIAQWAQTTPDSFTTFEQTLTGPQEAAITNYSDLHLEFEAVKV